MFTKKIITTRLSIPFLALTSTSALAVENSTADATFAGWPLLALIATTILFRKKIFSEVPNEIEKAKLLDTGDNRQTTPATKKSSTTPKKKDTKQKSKTTTKKMTDSSIIDLSNDNQCQASTTKGTRCKRTTTLEKTSVTIDNKTYQLIICKQHNTDKLKPFSGLIQK